MLAWLINKLDPGPTQEAQEAYEELLARTRFRQLAEYERLMEAGKHVYAGYNPPKDTDLHRTYAAARAQLARKAAATEEVVQ